LTVEVIDMVLSKVDFTSNDLLKRYHLIQSLTLLINLLT